MLPVAVAAAGALSIYLAVTVPAVVGAYVCGGLDAITGPATLPDLQVHTMMTSWLRGMLMPSALIGLIAGAAALGIQRRSPSRTLTS
ncbi:hypothetical protein EB73_28030 [Mycobacterium sp. SWH-M3]|nr:hypothetical protein EB73_28030 [Mycobacterium sp. SWH-M3]